MPGPPPDVTGQLVDRWYHQHAANDLAVGSRIRIDRSNIPDTRTTIQPWASTKCLPTKLHRT